MLAAGLGMYINHAHLDIITLSQLDTMYYAALGASVRDNENIH